MGALFKMYDDRQFCNGHRTVTIGMPMGYLISGNYSKEMNLQTIVEGRAQVGGNFLAGVATDEQDTDRQIDRMAVQLLYALNHKHTQPQNFYGVGGMKVFRDLIWLMQGMMKADHKFYKAHGQYDFPQKQWPTMLKMYLVGALLANPKLKSKMGNAMNEGMLMPYRKVLDNMDKVFSSIKLPIFFIIYFQVLFLYTKVHRLRNFFLHPRTDVGIIRTVSVNAPYFHPPEGTIIESCCSLCADLIPPFPSGAIVPEGIFISQKMLNPVVFPMSS